MGGLAEGSVIAGAHVVPRSVLEISVLLRSRAEAVEEALAESEREDLGGQV